MTTRHTGTITGSGFGGGKSYDALRANYVIIGDGERERAAQPSQQDLVDALHAQIAAQHPALVAAYKAIPRGTGRSQAKLRAINAWKREHRAGIEEAKTWPR